MFRLGLRKGIKERRDTLGPCITYLYSKKVYERRDSAGELVYGRSLRHFAPG